MMEFKLRLHPFMVSHQTHIYGLRTTTTRFLSSPMVCHLTNSAADIRLHQRAFHPGQHSTYLLTPTQFHHRATVEFSFCYEPIYFNARQTDETVSVNLNQIEARRWAE
ncbi:hypothetical protein [Bifidobacterium sp. B4142]|uniref:hypothetical protein n=1 Tax=Bifidobacterium sp. B4142 TaxID=2817962 RepID=UPI00226B32F1|nr:hypothetical protein [Bifidobacterium sp. B4142]